VCLKSSVAVISSGHPCGSATVTHTIRDPDLFKRRNQTGVDEPHAAFSRFVHRQSVIGLLLVAVMVVGVGSVLFCRCVIGMLGSPDTLERDELHQRLVRLAKHEEEPDAADDKRYQHDASQQGFLECELPTNGDLEQDDTDLYTITNHDPTLASGVLAVIHSVKKLVLVNETSNEEISQARQNDLPAVSQHTVDNADDEDENSLRKVETIAETRGLYEFGVISGRLGSHESNRIESHGADFQKPKREQTETLEDDEICIEGE